MSAPAIQQSGLPLHSTIAVMAGSLATCASSACMGGPTREFSVFTGAPGWS